MSGVHVASHIARRAVDTAHSHFSGADAEYIALLEEDAQLYEKSGPGGEVSPWMLLPVVLIMFATLLCSVYIDYAVGHVAASLAMIEASPSSLSPVNGDASDEAAASLLANDEKKKSEMEEPVEAEMDSQPRTYITTNIRSTLRHVRAIGGIRACLSGYRINIFYSLMHNLPIQLLLPASWGLIPRAIGSVIMSVLLCRWHMLWTHAMIATPSSKPFYARLVSYKQCRVLIVPAFVFAVAQQALVLVPLGIATMLTGSEMGCHDTFSAACNGDAEAMVLAGMVVVLVPLSFVFVAIVLLLPAAITLARFEAALLPEDQQTLVPFDRNAILGSASIADQFNKDGAKKKCCHGAIFARVWREGRCETRLRLVKLYVKMYVMQFAVVVVGVHLAAVAMIVCGGDKLAVFLTSASAQFQLMAIESAQEHGSY